MSFTNSLLSINLINRSSYLNQSYMPIFFTTDNSTRMVEIIKTGHILLLGILVLLSCNLVRSKSYE